MVDKIERLAQRIEEALRAFAQTMRFGGTNRIVVNEVRRDDCLMGRAVVVTGGGSGIGLAIAEACARAGAQVVITGRDAAKLESAVESLGCGTVRSLVWDIADPSIAPEKISRCAEILGGRIDILFNNAGVRPEEFFPNVSPDEWDRVYTTNSRGAFFAAQAVCNFWGEHPCASTRYLINISSQGGFVGATYPYRMSKWDIRGLTEGLGLQMAPHGVLVNGIAPGVVRTAMQEFSLEQGENCYCPQNPLGRVALPCEVAELALFMVSGACSFMVGQTVLLDGGYSLKS